MLSRFNVASWYSKSLTILYFVLLIYRFKVAGPDGSLYTVSHDDELGSDDEP